MKILAFMQNQWFKEPERIKQMYAERPEHRNEYIRQFLFMGCKSGKMLEKYLGEELCWQHFIWEEVSPEIGSVASSVFPPDFEHITASIEKHRPIVIIAFGKVASEAMKQVAQMPWFNPRIEIIEAIHPAARQDVEPHLKNLREYLDQRIASFEKNKAAQRAQRRAE